MSFSDVYFQKGHSHLVCEDYGMATAFESPQGHLALAVVSDGCSSSPMTDWGSRFLCQATRVTGDFEDGKSIIEKARSYQESLELPIQCLDATLLIAHETPDGDGQVFAYGDGAVTARRRDGTGYDSWVMSFDNSAPAYLSYLLNRGRWRDYKNYGVSQTVRHSPASAGGDFEEYKASAVPGDPFHLTFCRRTYDLVMVFSDGVESFQKSDGSPIPVADVLDYLVDLKVPRAGGVKRRVRSFLRKHCVTEGWSHYDDLGVGGVFLDPPPEDTKGVVTCDLKPEGTS